MTVPPAPEDTSPRAPEDSTACWVLWGRTSSSLAEIPHTVDHALAGFVFYPELEWPRFGYRPPENYDLLAAWRDVTGSVFVFLMSAAIGNHFLPDAEVNIVLYAVGNTDLVRVVQERVERLKRQMAKAEARDLSSSSARQSLDLEEKAKGVVRLMKLVGLFTVVVNAFSVYLRISAEPPFPNPVFTVVYQTLVALVHFLALGLLIVLILVFIAYAARYGLLALRKF